jgi:glycosyltransferase involved in cell wall biosynthesis
MRIALVIPAHNEEQRIAKTLQDYADYFAQKKVYLTFIVVPNACTDNTTSVVKKIVATHSDVHLVIIKNGGKGRALKAGFLHALHGLYDYIGFVDADGATSPEAFFQLVMSADDYDGIIASRYMPESRISLSRPWYKRIGSYVIYEPLVKMLFGISYHDLQCGAKLFSREVIERIIAELTVTGWAIDVELLFLCKKYKFSIKELPTTWYDQAGSKLTLGGGVAMLKSLVKLYNHHKQ